MALPEPATGLTCVGVTIGFAEPGSGWRKVVADVHLSLAEGRTLGIVGESGSGKSTLARAILGYRRPGAEVLGGSIAVGSVEVLTAGPTALAQLRGRAVAMVPQNPLAALTFHLRVGDQVEEVLRTRAGLDRRAARGRCLELLAEMGLPDPAAVARRYPHQLSGGQRQRVVIAAALACDPRLIVLDEPTTALDKTTEGQVLNLIERLRLRNNASLVLVTHDLKVVRKICDDVVVMKDGAVVEGGATAEVFARPRTDYTRHLLQTALPPQVAFAAAVPVEQELCRLGSLRFGYAPAGLFSRRAAATPALDDVSFDIGAGEIVGVIGESGSGKTTLGLVLAGMLSPAAGTMRFRGEALQATVGRRSHEQRRRIQMIFQDPLSSLNPRHTVLAAVGRPLRLFFGCDAAEARRRTADLLGYFGMGEEYLQRFPRQLSGGQQQRVAIARAFAAEPDLLICDEITSALDASIRDQVLSELLRVQRVRRAAMLVITHDLGVIARVASRLIVMRGGRIVEAGATADIIARPLHPYTGQLVEAAEMASAQPPGFHEVQGEKFLPADLRAVARSA